MDGLETNPTVGEEGSHDSDSSHVENEAITPGPIPSTANRVQSIDPALELIKNMQDNNVNNNHNDDDDVLIGTGNNNFKVIAQTDAIEIASDDDVYSQNSQNSQNSDYDGHDFGTGSNNHKHTAQHTDINVTIPAQHYNNGPKIVSPSKNAQKRTNLTIWALFSLLLIIIGILSVFFYIKISDLENKISNCNCSGTTNSANAITIDDGSGSSTSAPIIVVETPMSTEDTDDTEDTEDTTDTTDTTDTVQVTEISEEDVTTTESPVVTPCPTTTDTDPVDPTTTQTAVESNPVSTLSAVETNPTTTQGMIDGDDEEMLITTQDYESIVETTAQTVDQGVETTDGVDPVLMTTTEDVYDGLDGSVSTTNVDTDNNTPTTTDGVEFMLIETSRVNINGNNSNTTFEEEEEEIILGENYWSPTFVTESIVWAFEQSRDQIQAGDAQIVGDEWGYRYYHITTPLKRRDTVMYHYNLFGYSYGIGDVVDIRWVGYNYAASGTIINENNKDVFGNTGAAMDAYYRSDNDHLVLKFGPIRRYFNGWALKYQGYTGHNVGNGLNSTLYSMNITTDDVLL